MKPKMFKHALHFWATFRNPLEKSTYLSGADTVLTACARC